MPKTMDLAIAGTRYGRTTTSRVTVSADKDGGVSKTLAAAKTGSLTTRTDNDTGELTMAGGHGISTGNKLDVYWVDPTTGAMKSRVNMTVGTVATNQVPIDGGTGDVLPVATTAVTAMVPTVETVNWPVGAAAVDLQAKLSEAGMAATVAFFEGSTLIAADRLLPDVSGGTPNGNVWANGYTGSNPLATAAAAINTVAMSHGDATKSVTVDTSILYN